MGGWVGGWVVEVAVLEGGCVGGVGGKVGEVKRGWVAGREAGWLLCWVGRWERSGANRA